MAWVEIDYYLYDWHDWSRPGDLLLVSKRGRLLRIKPTFDHWQVTAERVVSELHPRLRSSPWFAPFTLEDDALVHPSAGRLSLADLEQIELAALGREIMVYVHARGGIEWAAVEASQLADFWLWLEMLNEREVMLRSGVLVHLPSSLSALERAFARGLNLPSARVIRQ